MRGYWKDPAATAEVLADDHWLRTGDLGHRDADGNLVLDGRVGDMYIRGGYNVYPVAVENVLAEHPAIDEVAVVGVPEPELGEIGVAFVVLVSGCEPPSLADVRAFCRTQLADYRAPDRLVVLDQLPLTPMLKVDKALLRRGGVKSRG
jgi:acyl-CoA synthetase (AMP-forming)/AMP-acid ligase II